jgi:uncharacterized DUF497 family protein
MARSTAMRIISARKAILRDVNGHGNGAYET